ncbi:MAG: response regulator [Oligoflexia bacterium]|nr:response regulator [Oligoflexia bacterium]
MARLLRICLFVAIAAVAVIPVLSGPHGVLQLPWLNVNIVAGLNLLGWSLALTFLFAREDLKQSMNASARAMGVDTRFKSLEALLTSLIREVDRKNSSLSINLIEKRITSKEELSKTLERIVALAFRLLNAESAELALFDKESGLYHSSFVLGKPFRSSAQAMLSGALDESEAKPSPDVMIHPISFAGSILGSLRVALKKGNLPTSGDQEIMRLLALQSSLALINAQYTGELVRMRRVSEESVKAKTGFLANLSHEIRGPLGIMLNAVELVLDGLCGPVSTDQLETLKMVRTNGQHLLELINDVLDYAKSESGKLAPSKVEIVLGEFLQDLCGVVRTQADAKKHKLTLRGNAEVLAISCDRRHARQMLINMLTNAIKYTPDGGAIEVWAERIPGNKIRISVKDSGVGIEESERSKVFAPFERVEHSYSINQMGTGLGMPLTRRLAEMNGGIIDFSSVPGQGSHFWLIFPSIEYNPTMREQTETSQSEALGKGELVMIVQRAEDERSMLVRYLTHAGFRVLSAESKSEALQCATQNRVNLIVVDNNVVDRSPEDVIGALRAEAALSQVPIVLVSSRAFVFDIEKYLKLGVDRCLSKPIELREVGRICRDLLDNPGAFRQKSDESKSKDGRPRSKAFLVDDVMH